jgi:transcriptional regulator with XRE-family HTH domain
MPRKKTHPLVGSNFEDFLRVEGRLGQATALAIKSVLARELERAMKESNVSQAELARRMKTSRAVVHRLLDANDPSITLATISKAATALGRSVRVALAARPSPEVIQQQLRDAEAFAVKRSSAALIRKERDAA